MDSLSESEMVKVATQQREAGVQRLSGHFSWPEFSDERRYFHQEFVYEVAMFATNRGFPWPDVIRVTVLARGVFPQLKGLDIPQILSLLRVVLSERLPNLNSVHRHEFIQFLTDSLVPRKRLFQAVLGGATDVSFTQLHLEIQLPPTLCPLAQGSDLHEWERRRHQAELASMLQEKEEQLRRLREGSRVTLGEADIPEYDSLDREGVVAAVRAALSATEGQMMASLKQEASLLSDILQLKLQLAGSATGRLHSPALLSTSHSHPDGSTKPGVRRSVNTM